ncbi:MAG: DUF6174 domain-containing protein [Gemmatimonadales bacterium]
MRVAGLVLAATAVGALVACESEPLSPGEQQLNEAELLWRELAIDSYQIEVTRAFAGAPIQVRVEVTDGVVTARRYLFDDSEVGAAEAPLYPDVPGLFALARDGFARAQGAQVNFHPTYGFPTRLIINYDIAQTNDDVDISVAGFQERTAPSARAE